MIKICCDKCGSEIKGKCDLASAATFKLTFKNQKYELCGECGIRLAVWLKNKSIPQEEKKSSGWKNALKGVVEHINKIKLPGE